MVDFKTFKQKLSALSEATSLSGSTVYHSIYCDWDYIHFIRSSRNVRPEKIALKEMYQLYTSEPFINTSIAQNYIKGRVYSPTCALLIAAGFYEKTGNRLN
jgi:hypothetical protein